MNSELSELPDSFHLHSYEYCIREAFGRTLLVNKVHMIPLEENTQVHKRQHPVSYSDTQLLKTIR